MPAGPGDEQLLVWERPEPAARQAPTPFTRPAIVAAAIAVADADGLDAVTFRMIAAVLDAGPMRLSATWKAKMNCWT